jgi:hypothetical protein
MNPEFIGILAQFGPAGLIGLLWIAERRHAAARDRQLSEAHARLSMQSNLLDAVVDVVKDNTRAITTLEHTQRQLIEVARDFADRRVSHIPPDAAPRT